MAKAAKPMPAGFHPITPHLVLDNAAQAIDFYKKAFGAQEVSRGLGPDGKIMHAQIKIGDSFIMLNDVMMGAKGPQGYGGSPASLWLYVDDCDALFHRATGAGAKVQVPLADQFSLEFQRQVGTTWRCASAMSARLEKIFSRRWTAIRGSRSAGAPARPARA